ICPTFVTAERYDIVANMLLAGFFAAVLFLLMIVVDWFQFTRLTSGASVYGFAVGRGEDQLPVFPRTDLFDRFGPHGVLRLPHGIAQSFREDRRILLRP